ncbi:MAG: Gfo/Idh/MocA family oxidoreductase [Chloroflexi bacterium]|nr:Gfo/Idh/MocA family oxidoreductase [Chloroflexota bacterium]
MNSELRAGVLGVRRGRSYVRVLQAMDGVSVTAVADWDAERRETVCAEHNVPKGFASLEELLAEDLDLVVVATPAPQHAEHSIQVLEANVNVISEIPILATREEAKQLVAAQEKSDALYMCGENCSYWAYVHTLKHLNERGDFGQIFAAEAEYIHNIPRLRRDEHGNRMWRSYMPPITYLTHSLGPVMWVTGQYPVEVVCLGAKEHYEPDLDDYQVAVFRMTDDSIVRISCSFANSHWGNHRQVFMGTKATFDSGWIRKDEPKFRYAGESEFTVPDNLPLGINFPDAEEAATLGGHGTAEWYMLKDFFKAIRTGGPAPIDVYDGIMYTLPGVCAAESAANGGQLVAIPQYQLQRKD